MYQKFTSMFMRSQWIFGPIYIHIAIVLFNVRIYSELCFVALELLIKPTGFMKVNCYTQPKITLMLIFTQQQKKTYRSVLHNFDDSAVFVASFSINQTNKKETVYDVYV